jgi:hypothetical protein
LPYEAVLGQEVIIRENGRERRVTAAEATRGGLSPRRIACFWRRLFLFRSTGSLLSGVTAPVLPKNEILPQLAMAIEERCTVEARKVAEATAKSVVAQMLRKAIA